MPRGPIYGPGPVAETFPEPLTELEHDLWVPPLREGVREAVLPRRGGDAGGGRCQRGGCQRRGARGDRPAPGRRDPAEAQCALTAEPGPLAPPGNATRGTSAVSVPRFQVSPRSSWIESTTTSPTCLSLSVSHRPSARRPVASRPRGPPIAPRPRDPDRPAHRRRPKPDDGGVDRARVLAEPRRDGSTDAEIVARSPVVLALTPPVGSRPKPCLPRGSRRRGSRPRMTETGTTNGILREALRLPARWVQELTGQHGVGARGTAHRVRRRSSQPRHRSAT